MEVLSAAAVAWQFAAADHEARERVATRLIAVSFLGLAVFVASDAVRALLEAEVAEPSAVGIGLASASLLIMPGLSWLERRAGRELGSASAVADSKQTLAARTCRPSSWEGCCSTVFSVGGGRTPSRPS